MRCPKCQKDELKESIELHGSLQLLRILKCDSCGFTAQVAYYVSSERQQQEEYLKEKLLHRV